jgi:hypothetical protein
MLADFYLKVGDTSPALTITCKYSDGAVQDLTGCTVTFAMWRKTGVVKVADAAATVVTPASGIVQYIWVPANTDTPGDFAGEFHVTLVGGKKVTFPTGPEEYVNIRIDPRIA